MEGRNYPALLFILFLLHLLYHTPEMGIADNITGLRNQIPPHIRIIAVSKTMPVSTLMEAYQSGQRAFGENKVQELLQKQPLMPEDTEWHMIGHLQTNKVKYVVPFISLIHSVDSLKLLTEINREAAKINRVTDCLLQLHIATEETKFGLSFSEAEEILNSGEFRSFKNVRITGLMGMATFTDQPAIIEKEFAYLATCFKELKNKWFSGNNAFCEISMGMSGDYQVAIAAGSTMVRIGSLIFGERQYK